MMRISVLLLLALVLTGCGKGEVTDQVETAAQVETDQLVSTPVPQLSLEALQNGKYTIGGREIKMNAGRYEYFEEGVIDAGDTTFGEVLARADFDYDGDEDALITLFHNTGGKVTWQILVAVRNDGGQPWQYAATNITHAGTVEFIDVRMHGDLQPGVQVIMEMMQTDQAEPLSETPPVPYRRAARFLLKDARFWEVSNRPILRTHGEHWLMLDDSSTGKNGLLY